MSDRKNAWLLEEYIHCPVLYRVRIFLNYTEPEYTVIPCRKINEKRRIKFFHPVLKKIEFENLLNILEHE